MDIKKNLHNQHGSPQYNNNFELNLTVNGKRQELNVNPTRRIVDILRDDLKLTGTKVSCEIGRCGACAILLDNKLVNSCLIMAYQANNSEICSIEGLEEENSHPIQQAFLEEGGFQCGYCTPGMIIAIKALLDVNPKPTQEQILEALSGNLCRCTGYAGIIRSIQSLITGYKE